MIILKKQPSGISFFEKYLTLWVDGCIAAGIAIGKWLQEIPATLDRFTYANVSLPVAVLI